MGGAHFSLNEPSTRGGGVPPDDDHAECEFDELRLGEATEKAIRPLRKDDEVVALMPAKEFVVHHGPKRTVLFWFCQETVPRPLLAGWTLAEFMSPGHASPTDPVPQPLGLPMAPAHATKAREGSVCRTRPGPGPGGGVSSYCAWACPVVRR